MATYEAVAQESAGAGEAELEGLRQWIIDHRGGSSWQHRAVNRRIERLRMESNGRPEDHVTGWHLGDWREFVPALPDGSINLVLTDPPYGINYQLRWNKSKHEKLQGDQDREAAERELSAMLHAVEPKLAVDAHVLIFCRWDTEVAVQDAVRQCGMTVKGSLIWVKNSHGCGDLQGGYAPQHERIVHAVKGRPSLYVREPDVLMCDKCGTDDHPTEKPVPLLRRLVESATVEGGLVVDPFAGVGATCVAAK